MDKHNHEKLPSTSIPVGRSHLRQVSFVVIRAVRDDVSRVRTINYGRKSSNV